MSRKIFACIAAIMMLCASVEASITKAVVNEAWYKISTTINFPVMGITYEKNASPNAWVHYESQKKYSIHVTTGLMKILKSEAEIAGVLAHEVGHVELGHYSRGINRKVGWTLLGLALGRAGGGAAGAALGSVGMNLAEKGFSRGQEVEADDYGTELLKKAGYDPYGLYKAMKAFADNKYITQPNGFNSHPPTTRRLKHLQEKAKAVSGK